jgi:F-type H+-transporting ATPase subunit epsilon
MAKLFRLQVFTPERQFYDDDVEALTVTTIDGQITFLADHEPIVLPVAVGTLIIKTPDETREVFSSEGFLEVDYEGAKVYIQACENPEEIDKIRAEEALGRAEERLRQQQSMQEYRQSKMAMARAMERLRIKNRYIND